MVLKSNKVKGLLKNMAVEITTNCLFLKLNTRYSN